MKAIIQKKYHNCLCCNNVLSSKNSKVKPYLRGRQLKIKEIVFCNKCSLAQAVRIPTEEELENFYNIDEENILETLSEEDLNKTKNPAKFDEILQMVFEYSGLSKKKADSFFDIGAGNGRLISHIQKFTNWNGYGIEPNPAKCRTMRELGINHVSGSFEKTCSQFNDGEFDLITQCQVLEHMMNPNSILKEIRRILSDDAVFYVEVPNCTQDYFASRYSDHNGHLSFWTEKSLRQLLKQHGFEVITIGSWGSLIPDPLSLKNRLKRSVKNKISWYVPEFMKKMLRDINGGTSINIVHGEFLDAPVAKKVPDEQITHNEYLRSKLFCVAKVS
jgi:SAM-dependent methyltransferase